MKLKRRCGAAAAKTFLLGSLSLSISLAMQGCSKTNSAAKDDAALRREFKRPRSINDVPADKRAMVEGILRSQREGKAPKAPTAPAAK